MITTDRRPTLARSSPEARLVTGVTPYRLELFGGGALGTETGPITGRAAQRHRIALLAMLATTRRVHRNRDQLITFLWPGVDAEHGRKLLSDSMYRVNQGLGGDVIIGSGDDLRLNRDLLGSDVADFESAVDAGDWRRVAELYAGPFLDGFYLPHATDFDQWMETERAQHARTAAKALETLATEARDAGHLAISVDWWQRLAVLAPDDSRVATELMHALEASGNRAGALRHARAHAAFLRETIGVEPDRSVQELADRLAKPPAPLAPGVASSSIAVLPFRNVSESDTSLYFADGVSEELMYLLTRTGSLRVASRTSAFAYRDRTLDVREVARRLNVDWILEGSVRRSGDRLRVVAQLTDGDSGYQVWSESFDRTSSDIFAIQAEIAGTIANRIAPSMNETVAIASALGPRAASNPDSYDLYFQARFHWHRRTEPTLRKSAQMFEELVEREPNNARAWAGVADAYAVTAFYDYLPPRVAFSRAEAAARQAIQLDSTLAAPHAALAYVDTYHKWNWVSAEQGFLRAIDLEPANATAHHWYGTMLATRGRFMEAEREMRRAAELDPLSMIIHAATGWVLTLSNENDRAIRQLEGALRLDPNFCLAHFWMATACAQKGRPSEALRVLQRSRELSPNNPLVLTTAAQAEAAQGDSTAARTLLDGLLAREKGGQYISSYQIAKVHLALGDIPAALTRLERAYSDRAHSMAYLQVDPQLRPLAGEARFQKLIERVSESGEGS